MNNDEYKAIIDRLYCIFLNRQLTKRSGPDWLVTLKWKTLVELLDAFSNSAEFKANRGVKATWLWRVTPPRGRSGRCFSNDANSAIGIVSTKKPEHFIQPLFQWIKLSGWTDCPLQVHSETY